MHRRQAAFLSLSALAAPWAFATPTAGDDPLRLAIGWREGDGTVADDRVGIVEVDWERKRLRIAAEQPVQGRAHGLIPMADGGFVAVANRPGRWLMRCDAEGRVMARTAHDAEGQARTFNGHVLPTHDGEWLFTTETASPVADSWVAIRDPRTLRRVGQFSSAGLDSHQIVLDDEGHVIVANGGLMRSDNGAKIRLDEMAPSLAKIDPDSGKPVGQWRLDDPRLSIRHIAWSTPAEGQPLLGLALQAEHDDATRRRDAPVLALWDGAALAIPTPDAQAAGYVGDITPAPGGGFVLSGQKTARGLLWQPRTPRTLTRVADLTEVCALAPRDGGVLLASARGVALWHPARAPRMLPWPRLMQPDNHWIVLQQATR